MKEVKEVIWESLLDGKYQVQVIEIEEEAHLQILQGKELLLDEVVPLMFGAQFGPDIEDVASWMKRAADFVDSL